MARLALAAIAAAAASVVTGSCGLVIGLEDRRLDPEAGTSGGPGGACSSPADCPVAGDACFVRICAAGVCGLSDAPEGTLVLSQIAGDCKKVVCDPSGNAVEVADATDPFDDGRPCTDDLCAGTKPTHKPTATGKGCGNGHVCNGLGACVECLETKDCLLLGGGVCLKNNCVPDTCTNMTKDSNETDVDCGGTCNACADGKACNKGGDCVDLVCTGFVCQAPACADGVKNGDESDVDCGGSCPPCADGKACQASSQCESGVCTGAKCQAPTCTDAVKNGDELDVDCGGSACTPGSCDDGEACASAADCQSGVCAGTCQAPTCADGVKNGTELGVDCGGSCSPCA